MKQNKRKRTTKRQPKENDKLTEVLMEEFENAIIGPFIEEPDWDALIHQRW